MARPSHAPLPADWQAQAHLQVHSLTIGVPMLAGARTRKLTCRGTSCSGKGPCSAPEGWRADVRGRILMSRAPLLVTCAKDGCLDLGDPCRGQETETRSTLAAAHDREMLGLAMKVERKVEMHMMEMILIQV